MLDELYKEQERKRKAARRGKIMVWYILLPIALLYAAFRIWQLITGKTVL